MKVTIGLSGAGQLRTGSATSRGGASRARKMSSVVSRRGQASNKCAKGSRRRPLLCSHSSEYFTRRIVRTRPTKSEISQEPSGDRHCVTLEIISPSSFHRSRTGVSRSTIGIRRLVCSPPREAYRSSHVPKVIIIIIKMSFKAKDLHFGKYLPTMFT